ncbi:MAG: DUF5687 family protein [Bacteroidota bacterium]
MLRHLLVNQWKEQFRSPFWTQSVVQTVILGLFGLYMMLNMLVLGFFAGRILEENFPDEDVVMKFSGLLIFYFLADLFMRFFLQSFPTLSIRPYLHLPIPKGRLVHYLLIRSISSVFTLLPLLLILPFYSNKVIGQLGMPSAIVWLLLLLILILVSNFLAFYMTKSFGGKPVIAITILGFTSLLFYLDYHGYIALSEGFASLVQQILDIPAFLLLPLGVLGLIYYALYGLFRSRAYLDDLDKQQQMKASSLSLGLAQRFGTVGEQIELEMKLIWRNSRSRAFVYISLLFLLYPLIFQGDEFTKEVPFQLFLGIFLTGVFTLNYGQLLLSWHSPHFDFILTQNLSIRDFFMARYYLLASTNLGLFILSLPYMLFYPFMIKTIIASFFYMTGIVVYFYMYFCNYNSKRIDPNKGAAFNMEGFGGAHYLIMIPILAFPMLLYWGFKFLGFPNGGLWALGVLGLLGIVFRDKIIDQLVAHFKARRYKIAAAFRKK